MNKTQLKKNDKLAFNLAVEMMRKYAKECEKDKKTKEMNPIIGTYQLINQLAIGLIYKADGWEDAILDVIDDAINDARDTVMATKEKEYANV